MAAVVEKNLLGTVATVLNTAATLTNNSLAISSAYNNTAGNAPDSTHGDGYARGRFSFSGTFGTSPGANTGLSIWLLTSQDGTDGTYEDGGTSTTPSRSPDLVIAFEVTTSAQIVNGECNLPPGYFKVLAKNDGSGQTISSGWTLKMLPTTREAV